MFDCCSRCAACSKCFLNSNKLKYHIRRTHLPIEGSLQCSNCDKECRTLRLLLNHQKSHIRVHCPHCKKIVSAANYDHHVRSTHANHVGKKRATAQIDDTATSKKKKSGKNKDLVASGSKISTRRKNISPIRDTNVTVSKWIAADDTDR